jgi:ATP-dependent exoDNAse (exonuclease V) alpha subunit
MELSIDQQAASDKFMEFLLDPSKDNNEMVISGHSGSGKSTLTKHLIKAAHSKTKLLKLLTGDDNELNIFCTATTNKAAKILSDATNTKPQTIHNLLGLKVMQNYSNGTTSLKKTGSYQILHNSLVIIDEASMIDNKLLELIQESNMNCKVLYVGDPYQLAPVFETTCPVFDKVRNQAVLKTVQRQVSVEGKPNPITLLGEGFREAVQTGLFPAIMSTGISVEVIDSADGAVFQKQVNAAFSDTTNEAYGNALIVAWSNNRVQQYNEYVRSLHTSSTSFEIGETVVTNKPILNKGVTVLSTDSLATITRIERATNYGIEGFRIKLDNSYSVFLAKEQADVKRQLKKFAKNKEWVSYFNMQETFADLRAIHASTVHKSQGSTFHTVFIDLDDIGRNNKSNEVARLLYVATTRATTKVVFYGGLPKKYQG